MLMDHTSFFHLSIRIVICLNKIPGPKQNTGRLKKYKEVILSGARITFFNIVVSLTCTCKALFDFYPVVYPCKFGMFNLLKNSSSVISFTHPGCKSPNARFSIDTRINLLQ